MILIRTSFVVIVMLVSLPVYSQVTFENVADEVGIVHSFVINTFAGGISFCDFNNDGFEDLSLSTELGKLPAIYQNQNYLFNEVAFQLGLVDSSRVTTLIWADYDNDGDKDLFIATFGLPNKLYRNDENGNYVDVTVQSGMPMEDSPSTAALWADFNNDGFIDLYVGNYELQSSSDFPNYLFENNGNGTFTDIAFISGATDTIGGTNLHKNPLAIAAFDYNNDGWQDIYIANDRRQGNTLLRNNGDGTFSDISTASGTDLRFDAMGVAIGDYDNDGYLDIYTTNGPNGNGLLRNNGDETFTELAGVLGVTVDKVCWGANFLDYDNDSDLDLFVSVSAGPGGSPDSERQNALFENLGDGTFVESTLNGITTDTSKSYGNAIGDFDNNGFCDIAVLNNYPTLSALWKNSGNSNKWVKLNLVGVESNRDGIGSWIEVYNNGSMFIRETHCGISYMSQNSSSLIIGAGEETAIDSIIIKWAGSGNIDILRNVAVNQTITVEEGSTITSVEYEEFVPAEFVLEQNYPNPFNPSTTIKFNLTENSYVTLNIFNVLGEEIAILINNDLSEGRYEVNFDALNFNSGVYFYRLTAYGYSGIKLTSVKKMILSK